MNTKYFFLLAISPFTLFATPTAPTALVLEALSSSKVSVQWQDNSDDEKSFKIFRDGKLLEVTAADVTTYIDEGLEANTTYTYEVKASDDEMYFISPTGNDANSCLKDMPCKTISAAMSEASGGAIIYIREGEYPLNVYISKSGDVNNSITITSYPDEHAVFSGHKTEEDDFKIISNWLVIKNLEIKNGANGLILRHNASHNFIENVNSHHNHFSGFALDTNASYNIFKNCDAHHNYDEVQNYPEAYRPEHSGGNADGFATGDRNEEGLAYSDGPGNQFIGCRSWENSDDGFDFYGSAYRIVVEKCLSYKNGYDYGDGIGFKLGKDNNQSSEKAKHLVTHSIAWENLSKGFDYNSNKQALEILDNTAYQNQRFNFKFPPEYNSTVLNNISIYPAHVDEERYYNDVHESNNSWGIFDSNSTLLQEQFISFDDTLISGKRDENASIIYGDFLRPHDDSNLSDMGAYHE